MKRLLLLAAIGLMACACNDDDNGTPEPAPVKNIAEVLKGNYWMEQTFLLRVADGREQVGTTSLMRLKYPREIPNGPLEYYLGFFRVDARGVVTRYFSPDGSMLDMAALTDSYRCDFGAQADRFAMTAMREAMKIGWFHGAELTVRSMTDERIEMDVTINDNTRREWAQWIDDDTKALRSVWERIPLADIEAGKWGDLANAEQM